MIPPKHLCQSCHCLVGEDDRFCSNCGQKKITRSASLREMLGEFFASIFSFDSKLIRTFLPLLFIPGKLTLEYLAGKRKAYYSPIRLFLAWMTIAFILLNFVIAANFGETHDLERNLDIHLAMHNDSLKKDLYAAFPDSIDQEKINPIFEDANANNKSIISSNNVFDVGLGPNLLVQYNDLFLLNTEELEEKYKVDNWFQKQLLRQAAKAAKNLDNFQLYLLSHLSWIILLSIPFAALFLKLLYVRRKRLYVEHLVYVLHVHSFVFAIFSCLFLWLLCNNQDYEGTSDIFYALVAIGLYFPISLYRVYGQGKIKTFFKAFLFLLGYMIIVTLALILFTLINFLFF